MKKKIMKNTIIYQAKSGSLELKQDLNQETIFASLNQIAELFDTDKSGVSRHINNIFKTKELNPGSTVAKIATVQKEGKRKITRSIEYYNLDVILSVGYRINSKKATLFRIWATKTLRDHIVWGYTVNRKRIAKNYTAFMKSVSDIQALLPERVVLDTKNILELIKEFASTWVSLDAYDKGTLQTTGATRKAVRLTGVELSAGIVDLRRELMKKGETSALFATEKQTGSIEGIVGNVMQSFGGNDVYGTVEEKAAHLLYFFVKNHPFIDGNKRSGAFAFVWFLKKTGIAAIRNINPASLTTLTLLVAESESKNKDKVIGLILMLLRT